MAYQIKVTLRGIDPPIWRRLRVPGGITFEQLHRDHDIVVEKQLKELKKYETPISLGGARRRPPEDVGGLGGYEDLLESIRDPEDHEREDNLRWAQKDTGGRLFDPEYFYVDEVNARLEHVLTDTPGFARVLLTGAQVLTGVLEAGWSGPVVRVGEQLFDWDRLGRLVSMLDDGVPVAIRVAAPSRRGRPN